jgi:hypothetical protein
MSSNGVPLQEISDTVGHKSTHVTETVYRHVIVPATGAARRLWTRSSARRTTETTSRARMPRRSHLILIREFEKSR